MEQYLEECLSKTTAIYSKLREDLEQVGVEAFSNLLKADPSLFQEGNLLYKIVNENNTMMLIVFDTTSYMGCPVSLYKFKKVTIGNKSKGEKCNDFDAGHSLAVLEKLRKRI